MKAFLRSNGFKVVVILLLTMAVFCGALLLATYTAEKSAFADDEPSYTQFIQYFGSCAPYDSASWYKYSNVTVTPHDDYFSLSFSGSRANVLRSNNSYNLVSGHKYCLFYHIGDTAATSLTFTGNLGSSGIQINVVGGSLRSAIIVVRSDGISADNIILYSQSSFSNLPVYTIGMIDITLLGLDTLSSTGLYNYIDPYHISKTNTFFNNAYWSNVSYNNGYSQGYTDGLLAETGVTYVCSVSDWTDGPNSIVADNFVPNLYVPSIMGTLNIPGTDDYRSAFNIGYADIFSQYSYDQLRNGTITAFLPSYYSYYVAYSSVVTDVSPINNIRATDFATSSQIFGSNGYGNYIDLIYTVLDNNNISRTLLVFRMFEHQTALSIYGVDYAYEDSPVYPQTWHTLNLLQTASVDPHKVVFTLQFNTVDGYSSGYADGIRFADSRVNDGSASYTAGYNYGVDSAGNFTFPSVISAAIDIPVQTARNLLNFDFFGTNLNSFVLSLLSFGIVVAVIKLILGR